MSAIKCRTGSQVHSRNGTLIVMSPKCHNKECPNCLNERAEKYAKMMTYPAPMILNYKIIPVKDAKALVTECNRSGEYYWKCPVDNDHSVIVTTKMMNGWIPFPTDEDSVVMIRKWIIDQDSGRISHTKSAIKRVKDDSGKWDTFFIPKAEETAIRRVLESSGWTLYKGKFQAGEGAVGWNVLSKILESLGIPVKQRIMREKPTQGHTINTMPLMQDDSHNCEIEEYQFSFTEDGGYNE